MTIPDNAISEEEWEADEAAAAEIIAQLKRFVQMACDDPNEKKRIRVSYQGDRFMGDFYIDRPILQKALNDGV